MTIDQSLWQHAKCFLCGVPAVHALEFELRATPAIMGACERHYQDIRAAATKAGFKVAEADALVPKGRG